jgi:hypothetical protein
MDDGHDMARHASAYDSNLRGRVPECRDSSRDGIRVGQTVELYDQFGNPTALRLSRVATRFSSFKRHLHCLWHILISLKQRQLSFQVGRVVKIQSPE